MWVAGCTTSASAAPVNSWIYSFAPSQLTNPHPGLKVQVTGNSAKCWLNVLMSLERMYFTFRLSKGQLPERMSTQQARWKLGRSRLMIVQVNLPALNHLQLQRQRCLHSRQQPCQLQWTQVQVRSLGLWWEVWLVFGGWKACSTRCLQLRHLMPLCSRYMGPGTPCWSWNQSVLQGQLALPDLVWWVSEINTQNCSTAHLNSLNLCLDLWNVGFIPVQWWFHHLSTQMVQPYYNVLETRYNDTMSLLKSLRIML